VGSPTTLQITPWKAGEHAIPISDKILEGISAKFSFDGTRDNVRITLKRKERSKIDLITFVSSKLLPP
jgi:hypothetical protein